MAKRNGKIKRDTPAANAPDTGGEALQAPAAGFGGQPAAKFPSWTDLLVMIGIFFVASAIGALSTFILRSAVGGMERELTTLIAYSVQFLLAIGGIYAYRRSRGASGSVFRFTFKWYNASLVLLGIVLILATSVVIEPLLNLFPDRYFEELTDVIGSGGWAILLTVVMAPVFEEMLFRGLVLESARQKWGATKAILLSAVLFGLVHFTCPPQMINAFVMGIIMGYIYVLTDSLISVILIHAVNNGIAYMLTEMTGTQAADLRLIIGNDIWYWVIYGVCLLIFLTSLIAMAVIATDKMRKRAEIAAVFTDAAEADSETERETPSGEDGADNNIE